MGNSLLVRRNANGLLANSVKRAKRLANGLLATGAVSWVISLF